MRLTIAGMRSPCRSVAGRPSTTVMLSAAKHLGPSRQTLSEKRQPRAADRASFGVDLKENTNSTL